MPRNFLDLPVELRRDIYDYLVQDSEASGYAHAFRRSDNQWHSSLEKCRQPRHQHDHSTSYSCFHVGRSAFLQSVYTITPKNDIQTLALTCRKTYLDVKPLLRTCNKLTIDWISGCWLFGDKSLPDFLDRHKMPSSITWSINTRVLHIRNWQTKPFTCTRAQIATSRYLKNELTTLKTFIYSCHQENSHWIFRPLYQDGIKVGRFKADKPLAERMDLDFFTRSYSYLELFMRTNHNRSFVIWLRGDGCFHITARLDQADSTDCVVGLNTGKWELGEWFQIGIQRLREEVSRVRAMHKQRVQRRAMDQLIENLEETLVMRKTME